MKRHAGEGNSQSSPGVYVNSRDYITANDHGIEPIESTQRYCVSCIRKFETTWYRINRLR
jgi:hypothetical protein